MTPYPVIERRKRKWVKGYGILSFTRYISTKYEKKKLLDTATKAGLNDGKKILPKK